MEELFRWIFLSGSFLVFLIPKGFVLVIFKIKQILLYLLRDDEVALCIDYLS